MKSESFIECSAYIRVLEKRLLNHAEMLRLSDTADFGDFLRALTQLSNGYDFSQTTNYEELSNALVEMHRSVYAEAYKLSGEEHAIVDLIAAKYDFLNLKSYVKAEFSSKKIKPSYLYLTERQYRFDGETEDMPEHLKEAAEDMRSAYLEAKNAEFIDITADKNLFKHLFGLCRDIDNEFVTKYVELYVDCLNIKILMRSKSMEKGSRFLNKALVDDGMTERSYFLNHYDVPAEALSAKFSFKYFGGLFADAQSDYERTGNYAKLEKLLDNRLVEHVRQAKYIAYGPEILMAWVLSKENEIRQLRILAAGKQNGLVSDLIRERLRDQYV